MDLDSKNYPNASADNTVADPNMDCEGVEPNTENHVEKGGQFHADETYFLVEGVDAEPVVNYDFGNFDDRDHTYASDHGNCSQSGHSQEFQPALRAPFMLTHEGVPPGWTKRISFRFRRHSEKNANIDRFTPRFDVAFYTPTKKTIK